MFRKWEARMQNQPSYLLVAQLLLKKLSVQKHKLPKERKKSVKTLGLPYAGLSTDQVQAVLSQPSMDFYIQ